MRSTACAAEVPKPASPSPFVFGAPKVPEQVNSPAAATGMLLIIFLSLSTLPECTFGYASYGFLLQRILIDAGAPETKNPFAQAGMAVMMCREHPSLMDRC